MQQPRKIQWIFALLASLLYSGCGGAGEAADVRQRLQAAYPGAPIGSVQSTPVKGLYQVSLDGQLMYSDASGRYLLFGNLHDMEKDGPQAADAAPSAGATGPVLVFAPEKLQALMDAAPRQAIRYVKGNGAKDLYIFSDPLCGYCRQLDPELDKITDVTVHYFVLPVLSKQSRTIAQQVWCAADRAKQWKHVLAGGVAQGTGTCETPLDDNVRLAGTLGIRGTPTLANAQGRVLGGYQTAQAIKQELLQTSEKK